MKRPLVFPSLLAADFARLADEAGRVEGAADWLHFDVMDYAFVPNLTMGMPVLESLLKATTIPIDCHLMIEDPDRWAPSYAEAGASNVTFHAEASRAPLRTARTIRAAGARSGLALNPSTPIEPYVDLLPAFDLVLVMTIEPGFGGQAFMDETLPKIRRVRQAIGDRAIWLQVDGGVTEDTIVRAAQAGADVFVAGSSVYGAADPAVAIEALRAAAAGAAGPAHQALG